MKLWHRFVVGTLVAAALAAALPLIAAGRQGLLAPDPWRGQAAPSMSTPTQQEGPTTAHPGGCLH